MQIQLNRIIFPYFTRASARGSGITIAGSNMVDRCRTCVIVDSQVVRVLIVNKRKEVLHFDLAFVVARGNH